MPPYVRKYYSPPIHTRYPSYDPLHTPKPNLKNASSRRTVLRPAIIQKIFPWTMLAVPAPERSFPFCHSRIRPTPYPRPPLLLTPPQLKYQPSTTTRLFSRGWFHAPRKISELSHGPQRRRRLVRRGTRERKFGLFGCGLKMRMSGTAREDQEDSITLISLLTRPRGQMRLVCFVLDSFFFWGGGGRIG